MSYAKTDIDIINEFNDNINNNNIFAKPSIAVAFNSVIKALMQSKSRNMYVAHGNTITKSADLINNLIHEKLSGKLSCRHCSSKHVILYGTGRGKQRYMCKTCGRTFTTLTNTPLNGTHHPEKWGDFMDCMLKSMTLKESADKVKVSFVTLFYWRHKILSVLKDNKPKEMKGVVELDDIYLSYSQKGQKKSLNIMDFFKKDTRKHSTSDSFLDFEGDKVCVIAAADRHSNVFSKMACIGRLRGEDVEKTVGIVIGDRNPICSNHKSAYTSFLNMRHLKRCRKSSYGIRVARFYIKRCLIWIHRFMGVATSYLDNYLGWYKFLHDINFNETSGGIKKLMKAIYLYN